MLDPVALYEKRTDAAHRRRYGQFFTPPAVADFMCRWVLDGGATEVFDPAFGLGALAEAAHRINPQLETVGYELDPVIFQTLCKSNLRAEGAAVRNADYLLSWNADRHPAIVCNPPYQRFQHFLNRDAVYAKFIDQLGLRLSGYTNIASAFLLKSLAELAAGGRLAYIMPLEFLNTGYGSLVKSQLLEHGRLKAFIRLEPEKDIFPDAITSVGLILAANDGKHDPIKFYSISDIGTLQDVFGSSPRRTVKQADLSPDAKWIHYFDRSHHDIDSRSLVAVREYGSFSRGIATGANEFFVLSRTKARDIGLSDSSLRLCITRSEQIKGAIFGDDAMHSLLEKDEEVLLLDAQGDRSASVLRYLRHGEAQGFHLRYLTKMRRPWYRIEQRTPAPLLFGVFSRGEFKVIRNRSRAINLTCFHCFYPNLFGERYIDSLFLYFRSSAARRILARNMRYYGNGLEKFEPNDLNSACVPSAKWFNRLSTALIQKGMDTASKGEPLPAEIEDCFAHLLS